jgi:hypothetical protein
MATLMEQNDDASGRICGLVEVVDGGTNSCGLACEPSAIVIPYGIVSMGDDDDDDDEVIVAVVRRVEE